VTHHHLTEQYLGNLARFATTFPEAHTLLRRIEVQGPFSGLWLSTVVNAHLYKHDAFLAYLKLKNPALKPPSLLVSPRYNHKIAAHTTDQSARLFPERFDDLLAAHGGMAEGWSVRHAGGATELGAATPKVFFDALFECVRSLRVDEAARPAEG